MKEESIVRENLMTEPGYAPYCGNFFCSKGMQRSKFNGKQFECKCGWVSQFPDEFIERYKAKRKLTTE